MMHSTKQRFGGNHPADTPGLIQVPTPMLESMSNLSADDRVRPHISRYMCDICVISQMVEKARLHIGAQAADVLSQRLEQHINTPLHQVTTCGPTAVRAETSSDRGREYQKQEQMWRHLQASQRQLVCLESSPESVMVMVLCNGNHFLVEAVRTGKCPQSLKDHSSICHLVLWQYIWVRTVHVPKLMIAQVRRH